VRRIIWMLAAVGALAAVACGSGNEGSAARAVCEGKEPGTTCNDGLCFNGAASGACDVHGECRTDPAQTGDCVVFLTSGNHRGNLGGLKGADAICQRYADAAGRRGTFKAWLSDSKESAAKRLTHSIVPYIDTRGRVIAADWKDLTDGALQRPLTVDETGKDWDADAGHCDDFLIELFGTGVWTSTTTGGDAQDLGWTCKDWTSDAADATGAEGRYCSADAWTGLNLGGGCSAELSLYCVQQ
jgi:hypothetical protein